MDVDRIKWSGSHPYCTVHESHYCPCLKPDRYDPNDPKDAAYIRGWEEMGPIVVFLNDEPPPEPEQAWWLRLDDEQMAAALAEGQRQDGRAKKGGFRHRVYNPGDVRGLEQHIRAAKGELAVSLMLDLPWTGLIDWAPDVGGYYEVRSVGEAWHSLIVRPADEKRFSSPFILTYVQGDEVWARGWEWGWKVAATPPQPASSVSDLPWWKTDKLEPMNELPPVPEEIR